MSDTDAKPCPEGGAHYLDHDGECIYWGCGFVDGSRALVPIAGTYEPVAPSGNRPGRPSCPSCLLDAGHNGDHWSGGQPLTRHTCPQWHRDADGWCMDKRPHLAASDGKPTEADLEAAQELHECNRDRYIGDDHHTCMTHDSRWPCEIATTTARALASRRAEIHAQQAAVAVAAHKLDVAVTAYMLGDLGGAGVGRAQRELRDALQTVRAR